MNNSQNNAKSEKTTRQEETPKAAPENNKKSDKSSNEGEVEALNAKIADLEERLLRAVAEAQNVQKRAEKERVDAAQYSISAFAKDVLSIRDVLQKALESCSDSNDSVAQGIKLTGDEMDRILRRYGVRLIEAIGQGFDPHFHQALTEVENKEKKPGSIVEVLQDGFMINDRLLRPALVVVAKGVTRT